MLTIITLVIAVLVGGSGLHFVAPRVRAKYFPKPELWDEKVLAHREHAELSPEFIEWALEAGMLNHTACHLCGRIAQKQTAFTPEQIDQILTPPAQQLADMRRARDEQEKRKHMIDTYEDHLDHGHLPCPCGVCDDYREEEKILNLDCGIQYDHEPHVFHFGGKAVNCDGAWNYVC